MEKSQPLSVWSATSDETAFPALRHDLAVDVAIVGGGISGLTAAALLARAGRSVALLDSARVATGETGRTTAHLTEVVDGRYGDLASGFGREAARLVSASSQVAIEQIEQLVEQHHIACGFERVPGYLYTERRADASMLEQELEAMRAAGVPAARTDDIPLPFPTARGLRVEAQAQLHPRRYLVPLARALQGDRVRIFEMTKVIGVRDGEPCRVETEAACVTARDVIVTANVPINNRVLVHTKLAAYRSYAVAASLPRTAAPRGLFWDTDEPYHYIRTQRVAGSTMVIVGGEDHKVGEEEDTDQRYQSLQAYLRSRFGSVSVRYHWSGQIIEPVDGLPFIGRNPFSGHVYVATGFSGNGMTFGTLAGMLLSDLVLGRTNPFADLYDARRVKPIVAAKAYLTENIGFPRRLVADRLTNLDVEASSVDEVGRGEGALLTVGGTKCAIYRDPHGRVHALSPICTHLACDVRWNTAERSWDCPCHGSRFTAEGKVLNGPAVADLAQTPLPRSVTVRRRAARSRGHTRQGRAGKQARQRRRS